jgi:hypothetical protein
MQFTIPKISTAIATQFPQGSVAPGLPIPDAAFFYFSTSADAHTILALLQAALLAFLATQQNGVLTSLGMTNCVMSADGTTPLSSFLGTIGEGTGLPYCIYEDPSLTYQIYLISGQITFRVPLPPNQPGPFNPPTVLSLGPLLVGNLIESWVAGGGTGVKLVASLTGSATEAAGILTFTWA